jgi:hypothetical protein
MGDLSDSTLGNTSLRDRDLTEDTLKDVTIHYSNLRDYNPRDLPKFCTGTKHQTKRSQITLDLSGTQYAGVLRSIRPMIIQLSERKLRQRSKVKELGDSQRNILVGSFALLLFKSEDELDRVNT